SWQVSISWKKAKPYTQDFSHPQNFNFTPRSPAFFRGNSACRKRTIMLKSITRKPVLATVISILLLILGVVSMKKLPVTRFPEIAPPSVSVSLSYPGANAETVAESVLLPVEEAINGVDNMTYIK